MPPKHYHPLSRIPSPETLCEGLSKALTRAEKLHLLLEMAKRRRLPLTTADRLRRGGTPCVGWHALSAAKGVIPST